MRHSSANEHSRLGPLGGIRGHAPLEKILRYVTLRCHFLHFEITDNGNSGVFKASCKA